jgi:hypothetical protein
MPGIFAIAAVGVQSLPYDILPSVNKERGRRPVEGIVAYAVIEGLRPVIPNRLERR